MFTIFTTLTMPAMSTMSSITLFSSFQKFLWNILDLVRSQMGKLDNIYLLGRDEVETKRLNDQHRFLVGISGHYIHPSIPKDLTAIADLGTGTGVWLEDIAKIYPKAYLHGFDISSAQYPQPRQSIPLSVHDVLRPFPKEHHSRYDLVHIRLLTAGLKKDHYSTVLANARALLKPGGYIQWEEVDHTAFCTDAIPEAAVISRIRHSVVTAMLHLGLWPFAPKRVHEEVLAGGFDHIVYETYTAADKDHLQDVARKWVVGVIRALVPASLLVNGEAGDDLQAREIVEGFVGEFNGHCQHARALVNLGVVVGRRTD